MPTLSHYSNKSICEPYPVTQDGHRLHKPNGFWVSVDGSDDWPTWCRENEWSDTSKQLHYRVEVGDGLLWLDGVPSILEFARMYPHEQHPTYIDWARVAKDWSGIVIAPYQWSLRLHSDVAWYYTWDCASGCIWDPSAIKSISLV